MIQEKKEQILLKNAYNFSILLTIYKAGISLICLLKKIITRLQIKISTKSLNN
jgi:hypothetical protein